MSQTQWHHNTVNTVEHSERNRQHIEAHKLTSRKTMWQGTQKNAMLHNRGARRHEGHCGLQLTHFATQCAHWRKPTTPLSHSNTLPHPQAQTRQLSQKVLAQTNPPEEDLQELHPASWKLVSPPLQAGCARSTDSQQTEKKKISNTGGKGWLIVAPCNKLVAVRRQTEGTPTRLHSMRK